MQGVRTVTGEGLNFLGWCYTVVLKVGITKTQCSTLGFNLNITQPHSLGCWLWWSLHGTFTKSKSSRK